YTSGSDVVFGPGRYDTEHSDGLELIAHELAHVVQNENAGYAHPDRLLSQESDAAENEAAYAANAVSTGHTVTLSATPIAALSLRPEGHGHAGWMDRLFGLNPDRSFVEAGMEGLGYGPTGIWGRPPAEDEGQGTTLLRALGATVTTRLSASAAVRGHARDELNHAPLFCHDLFDKSHRILPQKGCTREKKALTRRELNCNPHMEVDVRRCFFKWTGAWS